MHFSGLSSLLKRINPQWSAWLLRIVTGGVFMASGLFKAIDPWGGLYKITDYLQAWGIGANHEMALSLASLLATFEFMMGAMLVMGAMRNFTRWLAVGFMAFMTALTLYIWIADPVEDCGCFGDAFILSNSLTFWKNVLLLGLVLLLFRVNDKVKGIYSPALQWLPMVITLLYIAGVQIVGYHIQPLVDFRPFPVGTDMAAIHTSDADNDVENMMFLYEKDGVTQTFNAGNLPDSTWTFVERITTAGTGEQAGTLLVLDDDEDVTAEVFAPEGDRFILLIPDVNRYGISRCEMANRLNRYAVSNGAQMLAIAGNGEEQLDKWKETVNASYPVYTADATDIKMLARGDAAVVFLHDGKILWKRNIYSIPPDFPDNLTTYNQVYGMAPGLTLSLVTAIWLGMLVIIAVSAYYPRLKARTCKVIQK